MSERSSLGSGAEGPLLSHRCSAAAALPPPQLGALDCRTSGQKARVLLRTLSRRPDRGALQIELHSTAVRVQNETAGGSSSTAGSTHQRREQLGAAVVVLPHMPMRRLAGGAG